MRRYSYIVAGGAEPLRDYRKTISLLQNRLRDAYPDFTNILAVPHHLPDDKIEWTTSQFETVPVPLNRLEGEEREFYSELLQKSMARLKDALKALPVEADVAELHAIASVPSEDAIFCADNRIVIAEWGLRPKSGTGVLSLLSFADLTSEKGRNFPSQLHEEKEEITPEEEKPSKTETPEIIEAPLPEIKKEIHEEEKVPAPEPEPKAVMEEEKKEEIPGNPFKMVPPIETPADKKARKKKRTWLWLFIIVLAALIIFCLVMFLTRCASTESVATLPKNPPAYTENNIVLSADSASYIVNNRLNIMVLDGGSLDDFIKDFRKEFPDKNRYALSSPDTVTNRLILTLPPAESAEMVKQIPAKMSPKYKVIVAQEGMNISSYIPSDPAMNDEEKSYYFDQINAPEAWDIQKGNPDVIIAVLDDGFNTDHPEIKDKTYKPYDTFTGQAGTVASQGGHGQHTSGTAAGEADNNSGACGVAPGCKVMPVNIFAGNGAPDSLILDGLVYAAKNGAKVINLSIATYFGADVKFRPYEYQLRLTQMNPERAQLYDEVFRYLDEMGIVVVMAAGNETILAECDPMKRSQYPIIVSATAKDGYNIAIFDPVTLNGSNWGDRCDISAPGIDIYNSVPNGYDFKQGTSMACPQVAGGAALVMSQFPDLTPQEVKALLVNTAKPTVEQIGPLMDLAAALSADPNHLPDQPKGNHNMPNQRGINPNQNFGGFGGFNDPYEFYFSYNPSRQNPRSYNIQNPNLTPSPYNQGPSPINKSIDCQDVLLEMDNIQQEYDRLMQQSYELLRRRDALIRQYGACL